MHNTNACGKILLSYLRSESIQCHQYESAAGWHIVVNHCVIRCVEEHVSNISYSICSFDDTISLSRWKREHHLFEEE